MNDAEILMKHVSDAFGEYRNDDPYAQFFAEANERFRRRQTTQRLLLGTVLVALLAAIAGVRWFSTRTLDA